MPGRNPTAYAVAAAAALLAYILHRRLRLVEDRLIAEKLAREAESTRKNELALELMVTRNKLMHSDESVERSRKFVPAPSDVSTRTAVCAPVFDPVPNPALTPTTPRLRCLWSPTQSAGRRG